jgi:dihydrofolate synthase/folylpolyglutamate synthase
MALPDLLARVYARAPRGIELGLDRVRQAVDALGHPERAWGVLHIAGTNGKGSVAAISSLALERAGYRVGLFTSPHLLRFAERIRIDQEPIHDDLLAHSLEQALTNDLTFFEVAFVASLISFRESGVDCAVLEVGMGGRLDATNIVEAPVATAVTRVALDHTSVLGSTLREIAYEKACIAKPGCPMVIGPMDAVARDRVRNVAVERGASLVEWAEQTPWGVVPMTTALAGRHQQDNASVAAALCLHAARKLDRLTLAHVQEAVAAVSWPGRMESIHRNGVEILLDGAHNLDGVEALASHLESLGLDPSRVAVVFGAMRDKSWRGMVERLRSVAVHRFYVEPGGRAPARLEELRVVADGRGCRSVDEAIQQASLTVGTSGVVVVCGSLFLVAEARAMLLGLKSDPMVAL